MCIITITVFVFGLAGSQLQSNRYNGVADAVNRPCTYTLGAYLHTYLPTCIGIIPTNQPQVISIQYISVPPTLTLPFFPTLTLPFFPTLTHPFFPTLTSPLLDPC